MYKIRQEPEDITIEFYHKKAIYVSRITGCQTVIDIKKVEKHPDTFGRFNNLIMSTNGVFYWEDELVFDF